MGCRLVWGGVVTSQSWTGPALLPTASATAANTVPFWLYAKTIVSRVPLAKGPPDWSGVAGGQVPQLDRAATVVAALADGGQRRAVGAECRQSPSLLP